jgi:hypothetical protein
MDRFMDQWHSHTMEWIVLLNNIIITHVALHIQHSEKIYVLLSHPFPN